MHAGHARTLFPNPSSMAEANTVTHHRMGMCVLDLSLTLPCSQEQWTKHVTFVGSICTPCSRMLLFVCIHAPRPNETHTCSLPLRWYTACGSKHPIQNGPLCNVEKPMYETFNKLKALKPNITTILYLNSMFDFSMCVRARTFQNFMCC
jgi:hypothetical protein